MRPVPDGPTTAAIVAGGTVSVTSWKIGPRFVVSVRPLATIAGGTSRGSASSSSPTSDSPGIGG